MLPMLLLQILANREMFPQWKNATNSEYSSLIQIRSFSLWWFWVFRDLLQIPLAISLTFHWASDQHSFDFLNLALIPGCWRLLKIHVAISILFSLISSSPTNMECSLQRQWLLRSFSDYCIPPDHLDHSNQFNASSFQRFSKRLFAYYSYRCPCIQFQFYVLAIYYHFYTIGIGFRCSNSIERIILILAQIIACWWYLREPCILDDHRVVSPHFYLLNMAFFITAITFFFKLTLIRLA